MLCAQSIVLSNTGILAAFDWSWLFIFAFFAFVAAVAVVIIMLAAWITGGFNE
ncbi:MAG TPA: hypothetical protein VG269_23330 [Tepidisphaeraceae bacterium]|jgi:hypothetical protein|nr:hypothetical protein [Tepidisphaeraceae bacterium]